MYRHLLHRFCQGVSSRDLAKRSFRDRVSGKHFSHCCLFDSFSRMLLRGSCEEILEVFWKPIEEVLLCGILVRKKWFYVFFLLISFLRSVPAHSMPAGVNLT